MNKEFIPWEQAFELKQLGFKEECLGEWQNLKSGKNLVVYEEYDRIFDVPVLGADIGAPLYQQAFRWFREKYQLFSWVKVEYEYGGYSCGIYITGVRQSDIANGPYSTYEEAELACLRKLIEIVKNK